ncbi:MAG: hypothetical protein OEV59_05700 [Deltaproteobacteria bacterium]|nr:hypothetical protein [Deltaproteobacteria bacterium]
MKPFRKPTIIKTLAACVVSLSAVVLLTAMSRVTDDTIPLPEMNFTGSVIDETDVSTSCTSMSFEGETFFKGFRGSGVVYVPFEKIKKVVRVGRPGKNSTEFRILLKSGETIAVSLNNDSRLYGVASFGTFKILASNIKEINFDEARPVETKKPTAPAKDTVKETPKDNGETLHTPPLSLPPEVKTRPTDGSATGTAPAANKIQEDKK